MVKTHASKGTRSSRYQLDAPVIVLRRESIRVILKDRVVDICKRDGSVAQFVTKSGVAA